MRIADHAEERFLARFAVNGPTGIEDLVAAVLGIGLREHHEFDVGRIALQAREGVGEVVDLVLGKRKTHRKICVLKGLLPFRHQRNGLHGLAREIREEVFARIVDRNHGLRHAVVKEREKRAALFFRQLGAVPERDREDRAALNAEHLFDAAVAGDVGSFRSPGRNRAETRHHQGFERSRNGLVRARAVVEKRREARGFGIRKLVRGMHKMNEAARNRFNGRLNGTKRAKKTFFTEVRERTGAFKVKNDAGKGRHSC